MEPQSFTRPGQEHSLRIRNEGSLKPVSQKVVK